jgi:hypothetical protein
MQKIILAVAILCAVIADAAGAYGQMSVQEFEVFREIIRKANEGPLPSDMVLKEFALSVPHYHETLSQAPVPLLAGSYLINAARLKAVDDFRLQLASAPNLVVEVSGIPQTITKENAEAYLKGYADVLVMQGEEIQRLGFRQVGGTFAAAPSPAPRCQRYWGFVEGNRVLIAQHDFKLTLENGSPSRLEGVIIDDMIFVALSPDRQGRTIGLGKAEAGTIEFDFNEGLYLVALGKEIKQMSMTGNRGCKVVLTKG